MYTVAIVALILIIPWLVIPMDIRRQQSPYLAVLKSILVTTAAMTGVMAIASFAGHPMYEGYQNYISELIKTIMADDRLLEMAGASGMEAGQAQKALTEVYNRMFEVMPGCFMFISALVSYLYYIFMSGALGKKHPGVSLMPKFKEFRYPPNVISGMVLMYFAALLATKAGIFPNDVIFENINYVFDVTFIIQGASVVFMFFDLRMHRFSKIVSLIVVIICWNVFMLKELMVLVGMFDLIFNIKGFMIFKQQMRGNGRNK